MANPEHLAILTHSLEDWAHWRAANPSVTPDLQEASLAGTDLRGADLSFTNLRRADLRRAEFGNCNLAGADLREVILRGTDLSGAIGLLQPEQLAGADLAGAVLPNSLGDLFKNLDAAKGISGNAQKLFVATLAACLYCWLTIATTTDASLITNRASSPLPIIQTAIPIVAFYVVAPLLLVGVYFYFHLYLQKLWDEMGSLPAFFPDGRPLQSKADPWLLSDLVRSHVFKLSIDRPLLSYLQKWISILLAWWLVPVTLMLFWARYLPRHDLVGTTLHCILTAVSVTAAIFLYRLASATLRGSERRPFAWRSAVRRMDAYVPAVVTALCLAALVVISIGAVKGTPPRTAAADWRPQSNGFASWIPEAMAWIRYSPFADLRAADISVKPPNWTGKSDTELDSVKGLQLGGVDLRFSDLRGAFLAGSVLTDAHLEYADLLLADLRQAELAGAHLDGADLLGAHLNGADLTGTTFPGGDLTGADLTGAELKYADFTGATGLTPDQLAKANNWPAAFYSPAVLLALKLPPNNNELTKNKRNQEKKATPGNAETAEAERVAQLSRLIPGKNIEATTFIARYFTHPIGPADAGSPNPQQALVAASPTAPRPVSLSVAQLARLYDFPVGVDGHGQTIGLVELGGGYRDSDLDAYFAGLKIARPSVSSVSVDGAKNNPTTANSADGQVELDIEVAGAVAPGARIVVYFSGNTQKGWSDAVSAARQDTAHKPGVLLIDWGSPEGPPNWTDAQMQATNEELRLAATSGITVIVASGDNGATDGINDGRPHVDFPASSPWVLGVGGTKLIAVANSIASEEVWNDGAAGGATGGGVSNFFPRPDWQSKIPLPGGPNGQMGRGVPDVAANASPATGYPVLVDGQRIVIGGTSAAAPLWAGLIALLNQSLGHNVGYLNPLLYDRIGPSGALHAIVNGNNSSGNVKGCSAGPGWNSCAGWGSPDGKKLLESLRAAF